ncbi:uncharacterized protein LOC62_03G003794 [Vanrija pseudolonga]|uniref:Uncharacterized protein n=1 Tax=Vanrija pseudolonga TaxID=143232 RepID=A0AAF0Y9L4_9TREE|nr:hypothetical protein LOC62_03G003794 [Vanrija pseudolonga]
MPSSSQLKIYALFYALQLKAGLLNLYFYASYHGNLTLFAALLILDGVMIDYGMWCTEKWIADAREQGAAPVSDTTTPPAATSLVAPPEKQSAPPTFPSPSTRTRHLTVVL